MRIKPIESGNKGCVHRVSTQGKRKLAATLIGVLGLTATAVMSHEVDPHPHAEDSKVGDTKYQHSEHGGLAEIGRKLANPLAALWSLSANFETPKFYDGDVNQGDTVARRRHDFSARHAYSPVWRGGLLSGG
jgi:hypothetical protein